MKRLINSVTQFNANELSALKSSLEDGCRQWLINNGFPEVRENQYDVCVDDMLPTIWMSEDSGRLRIELGMELGYDSMLDLAFNYLDPIIVRYDNDAYFDMADSGLMVAYLDN